MPRSLSLSIQLLITLVGLVVITTVGLTFNAYRSFRTSLENDARKMARASAEQTAQALVRLIERQQERAEGFLGSVDALCGERTAGGRVALEDECLRVALTKYRDTERARGVRFVSRSHAVRVGDPPRTDLALAAPLARFVARPSGFDYVFLATNSTAALTVQFSSDHLDTFFHDHPGLGGSGEVFLADTSSHFLTTRRYPATAPLPAAALEPIFECLRGPVDLVDLDYRGVKTFHGIRPVTTFLGSACVDAHVPYDEALAPADALLGRLAARGAIFALVGAVLSLIASHWIAAPVRRLAASARALGEGNFERPIPVAGPSEIRALGRGFEAMARAIADLALRDALTNLPNRRLLHERLAQAITASGRHDTSLAIVFLDLDGFKHVNDSLGHERGDKLLQSVAGRLQHAVRRSDTVSRQGGDEFVVLLTDVDHADAASRSARKMIAALAAPHHVDGHELHVTASLGISLYPDDGQDPETLLKNADTAMYYAKEGGRNSYQFFKADMNVRAVERQWIEADLRRALAHGEFTLLYQPKVDLATGRVTGAEALIRWEHPDRGMILPMQFVQVAEECGCIVPIGQWVLAEACRQARGWIDAGLTPVSVSVNISALEFRDKDFVENLCRILQTNGLEPQLLELELTESVLMQHAESTAHVLRSLKDVGVQIAIDDFGTGYSSLSYLRQFPIDALKIDRSFVHEITDHPSRTPIVSAVISMGKGLNHRVVAEGVETAGQLAFLQASGCGEGQGHYFSRPVAAADFAALLEAGLTDTVRR